MNLISRHLSPANLKLHIHNVCTVCAFTGEKITAGVKLSELVKETFTDHELLRYPSQFASVDIALLIENVIPTGREKTTKAGTIPLLSGIRNFSFFATKTELRFLKREDILALLLNIPETPFQIGITYSHKKHIAFRCQLNADKKKYIVTTDTGNVPINIPRLLPYINIIQNWYTIVPGKKETSAQPTYFTKAQILGEQPSAKQVNAYGTTRYFAENKKLEQIRHTAVGTFLVHIINKK